MDIQIGSPKIIWLIVVIAIGCVSAVHASIARRQGQRKFGTPHTPASSRRALLRNGASRILLASGLLLLTMALLDIRWGKTRREVPQKGIEVMFAVDVSRSMLAEDATPNRLTRAKQQIKDMLHEMAGDRVGLIAFAGDSRPMVPLTSHYEDFRQTLDSIGPQSVRRGGSSLRGAIEAAANGFMNKTNDHKAIVLFTDGEDQDSQPVELAQRLHNEQGIRIFTVGLGDAETGSRIPTSGSGRENFVQYDGQQVWSKMNGQILSQIAAETDGAYIPAGTKQVNMADIYRDYIGRVEQTEFESATIDTYTPRFQWFAVPALVLLLGEVLVSTSGAATKRSHSKSRSPNPVASAYGTTAKATSFFALLFLSQGMTSTAFAQASLDASEQTVSINEANELVRAGRFPEAIEKYTSIASSAADNDHLNYNLGVAEYHQGDFTAAADLFEKTAASPDDRLAASSRYNLGNCKYTSALQMSESDKASAIEALHAAISHYRSSLELDGNNSDARANIELAVQLIRKLEQEQEKEQEEQQQGQKQQPPHDPSAQDHQQEQKPDDPEDPQASKSNGNQAQEQPSQDQNSQKPQSSGSESQQAEETGQRKQPSKGEHDAQNQPSPSQKDQVMADDSEQQDSSQPTPGNDQKQSSSDSNDSQTGARTDPKVEQGANKPAGDSAEARPQAQGENRQNMDADRAAESANEDSQAESRDAPRGELSTANLSPDQVQTDKSIGRLNAETGDGRMTREEALKMLQSVRDRDMLRRLRQDQMDRARRVPVDRDW